MVFSLNTAWVGWSYGKARARSDFGGDNRSRSCSLNRVREKCRDEHRGQGVGRWIHMAW